MTPRVLAVDEPACLALPQGSSAPRRIRRQGSLFSMCGCCSRKRGRLDWHQPNIPQLARVPSAAQPQKSRQCCCAMAHSPHTTPTPDPLLGRWVGRAALRVSAGDAGGSCPCPGDVQGAGRGCRVSQGNWGGLWPRLSCGLIDPFDRHRRASPALRDPDPPCGGCRRRGLKPLTYSQDNAHPSTCPQSWCHRA